MCLTAYVDDSGSEPSEPTYVLGGVVLPSAWWTRLSEEWSGVLNAHPSIDYFKACQVWDKEKGPFAFFTDDQRMGKVDALVDVLTEYHPMAISCRMRWDTFTAFRDQVSLPKGKDDPYFYLFYGIIILMILRGKQEANFTPVDFIFDNQNRVGKKVLAWHATFKDKVPLEVLPYFGNEPRFGDEKQDIPLQAADLFAWYHRRNVQGSLHGNWQLSVWDRLSKFHSSSEMEAEHLMSAAAMVGII